MAIGSKKITDVFNTNTGGEADSKSITDSKKTEIKNKFDSGEHIEDTGMFENLAPALHAIQLLAEDIQVIRDHLDDCDCGKVNLLTNNAKIDFSVLENRGSYTLRITMTDTSSGKQVVKTADITLR